MPVQTDADKESNPHDAVAMMRSLLEKKDYKTLYQDHCHKRLRDQVSQEAFIAYLTRGRGTGIVDLFAEVDNAIKQMKGREILIAGPQEQPDEYEFILVQVKKRRTRKGQQWHLELKKEDGKWKLIDTD